MKVRAFATGITLAIWGTVAESAILVIIGVTLMVISLAAGGGFTRRSGVPGHQPPVRTPPPHQPPPTPAPRLEPGPPPEALEPPSSELSSWSFEPGGFDVVVLSPGPSPDRAAELLGAILGIGPNQARELLARRISTVKRGVSAEDADLLKQQLEAMGASVQITAARKTPPQTPGTAPKAAFFDVVLTDPGPNKIATRKALKNHLGLDLLQAYNAVEQTPSILKQDITRTEAERLRAVLESAGATVELRPSAQPS